MEEACCKVDKQTKKEKNWYNREGKEHLSINNIYKELVQLGFDYCDGVYDSMSKTLATELRKNTKLCCRMYPHTMKESAYYPIVLMDERRKLPHCYYGAYV